jgi:ribonuclease D
MKNLEANPQKGSNFAGKSGALSPLRPERAGYHPGVIDSDARLAAVLPKLRAATWIAVDTEADSLHAYPEKLCLMQISVEGLDALLDTLAAVDLAPVLSLLHNHELILHGSDYDLRLLRKTFDFVPRRIFDTMLAARLLGHGQVGLGNLVARYLGVTLEKGPQKADWGRRPLTPRMETYARNDTHYLKPLAELLRGELTAKGRLDWHTEWCARFIREGSVVPPPDPEGDWRVKGSHVLEARALAVLRELWHWREAEAIAANRPPFFVLMPETMVSLAQAALRGDALDDIVPPRFSPRRRAGVMEAIRLGLACKNRPAPLRHHHRRLTEAQTRRYREIERRRDRCAAELALDPSLIASRATLAVLALGNDSDWERTLMSWQRRLLEG